MKACTRCGSLGPFYKRKGGWSSWCRECTKADVYARRRADPERAREIDRESRKRHPETKRKNSARYRAKYPEKTRAVIAAWAKANPEKVREKSRRWQAENPAGGIAWRAANPRRLVEYRRRWGQRHPEMVRYWCQIRRARVAGAPGTFTVAEWREILEVFGHVCGYCLRGDRKLTQEHVIPISRGGAHDASNIVPACSSCNPRKGDRPIWSMLQAS